MYSMWLALLLVTMDVRNVIAIGHDFDRPVGNDLRPIGTFYDARREMFLSRGIFYRPIQEDELSEIIAEQQETKVTVTEDGTTDENTLNVEGELGLSIAAGMVKGELGGSYKKSKLIKSNSVTGIATVKAKTGKFYIDLCDENIRGLIDPKAVNTPGSHILTGETRGANIIVRFWDENKENELISEIKGKLQGSITKFANLLQGSLKGKLDITDNSFTSKRKLRVEIIGDIGFTSFGVPVSEEDLMQFMRNVHLHLNPDAGKYGKPIIYHFTAIEGEIQKCISNTTNSVLKVHDVETKLTNKIIENSQKVKQLEADVEFLYNQAKRMASCIQQNFIKYIQKQKTLFDEKVADYRLNLQNAVVQARSGANTSLINYGNKDLYTDAETTTIKTSIEEKYNDFEEIIDKLEFFDLRGISCVKRKVSIENAIFKSSDNTVYIFLYNKESYTTNQSVFMQRSHDLLDSCKSKGTICFVVDCDQRKDSCNGFQTNSIYLYIRGQLVTSNFSRESIGSNSSETILHLVKDIQDKVFNLEKSSLTIDKLVNNMYRDQRNMKTHFRMSNEALELHLNYTFAYQKLVFDFILDDVIKAEAKKKYALKQLQNFPGLGGLNVTQYCRPYRYHYLLLKLKDQCSSDISEELGLFGHFNYY